MIVLVPLDLIQGNPWQTRTGDPAPEYVKELALDIARNGLMQHPVGRLLLDGHPVDPEIYMMMVDGRPANPQYYIEGVVQLAFGHNRLAAYKWLRDVQPTSNIPGDFSALPVDLRRLSDEQMADFAWSENEKRRNHTPYERALAIQRRQEYFCWTQQQVADHLGLSRSAVTNVLRLLKLPESVLTALADGRMSERVAMALVSLFDLPETLRHQAEIGYRAMAPTTIIQGALSGSLTSDRIRENTEQICSSYGRKLDGATWALDEVMIVENVKSPVCKTCPSRLPDRNLCMSPECFDQKKAHAKGVYLANAADACGIPPLESEKSPHHVTEFRWWRSDYADKLPIVRSAGCENLRVMYDPVSPTQDKVELKDRVNGYPNAKIVCCKSEQFCTCLKGLEYAQAAIHPAEDGEGAPAVAAPTAEDLKDLARAARAEKKAANQDAKDILREAAERIATGLSVRNHRTWRKLAEQVTYKANGLDDRDLWTIQMMIATKIAEQAMPYEIKTYDDVLSRMNKLLTECGLDPIALPDNDYVVPVSEDRPPAGKTLMDIFVGEQES